MSIHNRLGNSQNPFQGKVKKVLCVCSAGLLRSPTAANVIHNHFGFNTRAVGHSIEYALIPLEETHIYWADEIVVMDDDTKRLIIEMVKHSEFLKDEPIIHVLNIPDNFEWMNEDLQDMILADAKLIWKIE